MGNNVNPQLYLAHLLCPHSPLSLTPMSLTLAYSMKAMQRRVYLVRWPVVSSYLRKC